MKPRVRFAPSPTGPLHIGGVRTALFNYLFAKKNEGTFLLRIEDTDQTRYVEGAEEYIIESLKWCNINFDEGFGIGGDFGPYKQSERRDIYREYADKLVESGNAYYAFDTPEELDAMRLRLQEAKADNQQYNALSRIDMCNSLTLTEEEIQKKFNENTPFVIRFKMPKSEIIKVSDIIRGNIEVNTNTLDDKVLFKSDGLPTYHLANVVDDYLMKITHVIRGEEWLPSLPLHVMLYKALGWESEGPVFAHLPLILKPSGKGKLSKRDGDKGGFPVFPIEWISPDGSKSSGYRESGYFAEAFINMIALLGWNPGTEQEIFSLDELSQNFSVERVGKSGSKFDPEKAKWFNREYLQKMEDSAIASLIFEELKEKVESVEIEKLTKVISLVKDRANFANELWQQMDFFFVNPIEFNAKVAKKRWKGNIPEILTELKSFISGTEDFISQNLEEKVKAWIEEKELGMGQVLNALRLALVGDSKGPHLFDIMEIVGKKACIERIDFAIENL